MQTTVIFFAQIMCKAQLLSKGASLKIYSLNKKSEDRMEIFMPT